MSPPNHFHTVWQWNIEVSLSWDPSHWTPVFFFSTEMVLWGDSMSNYQISAEILALLAVAILSANSWDTRGSECCQKGQWYVLVENASDRAVGIAQYNLPCGRQDKLYAFRIWWDGSCLWSPALSSYPRHLYQYGSLLDPCRTDVNWGGYMNICWGGVSGTECRDGED